jgi:hypothetical protein
MGVSFFVKKESVSPFLMQVDDCDEHNAEFTDVSNDGGSSGCEELYSYPASYVEVTNCTTTEGGNIITNKTFPTNEKITIEFYWSGEDSNWYDDALFNTMNYLFIVKANDYTINTTVPYFGRPESSAWMRLNMRAPSENITLEAPSPLGVVGGTIPSFVPDTWTPIKMELDWPNETVKAWGNDFLVVNESIPSDVLTNVGSAFQFGFHWHTRTLTGRQHYSRIHVWSGDLS